jgi:hypothetical protein
MTFGGFPAAAFDFYAGLGAASELAREYGFTDVDGSQPGPFGTPG